MGLKDHRYDLTMVNPDGSRRTILEGERDARRVRDVALGIKRKPGRKLIISRDGKELPGGANALDTQEYARWLEESVSDG